MRDELTAREHLQRNLRALVGDEAVLPWSKRHGLVQTTVARAINGTQDLTTTKLQEIAAATGLHAWQLIAPNLGEGMMTVEAVRGHATVVPVITLSEMRQQMKARAMPDVVISNHKPTASPSPKGNKR